MPTVARPDGVELHWEERGEGPLVVLAHLERIDDGFASRPDQTAAVVRRITAPALACA